MMLMRVLVAALTLVVPAGAIVAACGPRRAVETPPPVTSSSSSAPPIAGPACGGKTCAPNEYCEIRCTCCGTMVGKGTSADYTCKPIPAGCSAASLCACASVASAGLCSDRDRSINVPCA